MSTITPPNVTINGVAVALQALIEARALTALVQSTESPNPASDDLTKYRQDAAFDVGVNQALIIP